MIIGEMPIKQKIKIQNKNIHQILNYIFFFIILRKIIMLAPKRKGLVLGILGIMIIRLVLNVQLVNNKTKLL